MRNLPKTVAAMGALTLLAGIVVAPGRTWPSLLVVSFGLVGVGLAGIFFVALQYATGSGWSASLRRVPESMAAVIPVGALGLACVLALRPAVYSWTHEELSGFKEIWLSLPFFIARSVVYVLLWTGFAFAIIRTSRRQDADGDLAHTHRNVRLSAVFLVVFAVTFWLASYDWVMSLEPEWASTIFGVYNFAGLFQSGLAVMILLVIGLRRTGPLGGFVNEEHLHDLGKLLFAFSTFWMYIWFSQYMLVWYANLPEEAGYYVRRLHGYWKPLFLLNMLLNWVVPFVVLLPRRTKRDPFVLSKVAAVVVVGRWLDLYLMIVPPSAGEVPPFGIWEIGPALGAAGLFVLVFRREFSKAQAVPVRDPFLEESLHYQQ
jgi:hypothetical protein